MKINELKITHTNGDLYSGYTIELNNITKYFEHNEKFQEAGMFTTRKMKQLLEDPEFLDFVISNYKSSEPVVDFDSLIVEKGVSKSMQVLFYRSRIAMNYFGVITEMLMKLRNRKTILIKLEDPLKNFNIETIVKLQNKEEMKEFFDYQYIENKYPEMYI